VKVWIYRGDAAPTRAAREAQQAALRAQQQQRRGSGDRPQRRRRGGDRPDNRGGDRTERSSAPASTDTQATSGGES
jgi:small subunit ribosomal protein S3